MLEKEIDLETKREEAIKNLLSNPVENELYTISFVKKAAIREKFSLAIKKPKNLSWGFGLLISVNQSALTSSPIILAYFFGIHIEYSRKNYYNGKKRDCIRIKTRRGY